MLVFSSFIKWLIFFTRTFKEVNVIVGQVQPVTIGKVHLYLFSFYFQGNLCNHTPKGKILPFRNFAFYFSYSVDFGENKWHFIHCNSDVEVLPKKPFCTLTALLVGLVAWKSHISKVQISCPLKPMAWLMYMSPSNQTFNMD